MWNIKNSYEEKPSNNFGITDKILLPSAECKTLTVIVHNWIIITHSRTFHILTHIYLKGAILEFSVFNFQFIFETFFSLSKPAEVTNRGVSYNFSLFFISIFL